MNDRLRNERGRFSTAEETSDHEKEILNPEITGQTLAQHSSLSTGIADTQKTVTTPHEKEVSQSAVHRDNRHTDDGDGRHSTRVS